MGYPNQSPMGINDPLADGEAQAGAFRYRILLQHIRHFPISAFSGSDIRSFMIQSPESKVLAIY